MAATATVQFRLEPEKKKAAEELFNGMGLTLTTAFALFIQQSLNCNGLPFPVLGKQQAENIMPRNQDIDERMAALSKINSLCRKAPLDFDYAKELAEARDVKYESVH